MIADTDPRLRQRRIAAGLTQVELAQRAQCEQQALSAYERGASRPSLATARRIARALDCTLDDLFGGPDDE